MSYMYGPWAQSNRLNSISEVVRLHFSIIIYDCESPSFSWCWKLRLSGCLLWCIEILDSYLHWLQWINSKYLPRSWCIKTSSTLQHSSSWILHHCSSRCSWSNMVSFTYFSSQTSPVLLALIVIDNTVDVLAKVCHHFIMKIVFNLQ